MLPERRVYRRIPICLPINYETLETQEKICGNTVSKDISEGGLRLISERFFPPKTKFLLKINLEQESKMVETIAETVWSFNLRYSNMYHNGLRFTDTSKQNQTTLREYILIKDITK